MTETFLILLAAGIWASAAVVPRRGVATSWFRLAALLGLALLGCSVGFFVLRSNVGGHRERTAYLVCALLGVAFLVSSTTRQETLRRILAVAAAVSATAGPRT